MFMPLHLLGYPNSLIPSDSKKNRASMAFNVSGNNRTFLGVDVKCSILIKFGFS
jgi:hypothetical protein